MKIEKTKLEPVYQPVTLTITLESEMEERVLRAICRADSRKYLWDRDIRGNEEACKTIASILNTLYRAL